MVSGVFVERVANRKEFSESSQGVRDLQQRAALVVSQTPENIFRCGSEVKDHALGLKALAVERSQD